MGVEGVQASGVEGLGPTGIFSGNRELGARLPCQLSELSLTRRCRGPRNPLCTCSGVAEATVAGRRQKIGVCKPQSHHAKPRRPPPQPKPPPRPATIGAASRARPPPMPAPTAHCTRAAPPPPRAPPAPGASTRRHPRHRYRHRFPLCSQIYNAYLLRETTKQKWKKRGATSRRKGRRGTPHRTSDKSSSPPSPWLFSDEAISP